MVKNNIYGYECLNNDVKISVFCALTDALIGTFDTIKKAEQTLIGKKGNITWAMLRKNKSGKIGIFKLRDGRKAYAKKVNPK